MSLIALALFISAMMPAAPAQELLDLPDVVSGVVREAGTGMPVAGAQVSLGPVSLGEPRNATTDGEGRFVFAGLTSGNLRLTASRDGYFAPAENVVCPQTGSTVLRSPTSSLQRAATACVSLAPRQRVDNVILTLIPGGTIRGRIVDPEGRPAVSATVQSVPLEGPGIAQTIQTDDRGEFRLYWVAPASYVVRATLRAPSTPPDPNRTPVPTYFPGAIDSDAALPVVVTPGSDRNAVDVSIRTATTQTISGRIQPTTPSQRVSASAFYLIPRVAAALDSPSPSPAVNASPNRVQGEFEFRGVRPGGYDIVAVVPDENQRRHFGRIAVEVGSANVGNILVPVYPGVTVSGKMMFSPRLRLESPQQAQNIYMQLIPMDASPALSTLMRGIGIVPRVTTDSSGNFTMQNVTPGRYLVSPTGPFYVADARQNGATVPLQGFQVSQRPVDDLEVVADESGSVRVTVRDAQQQPIANATVLLIPDSSRRGDRSLFKVGKTSSIGFAGLGRILPGEYRISVWADDMPAPASFDDRMLDAIEPFGVPIHALAGTSLELRYVGSPGASAVALSTGGKQTEVRPIQVVPADAAQASVEGRVWKGSQQAAGATVVLIPEGPRRADPSQFKTVTTSATGYFVFRGGLSGRYAVMAFENLPPGALENAAFLAEQEQKGRVVHFDPAGSASVQLNIIPKD
jgi:hypothetical protein